jgi:hypothetical protein
MVNEQEQGYTVRFVPFDEWADVDTLLHRAAVSSGDFDYLLRPLCPDCGGDLRLGYEEVDGAGAGSALAVLVCDICRVTWQLAPDDEQPGD